MARMMDYLPLPYNPLDATGNEDFDHVEFIVTGSAAERDSDRVERIRFFARLMGVEPGFVSVDYH